MLKNALSLSPGCDDGEDDSLANLSKLGNRRPPFTAIATPPLATGLEGAPRRVLGNLLLVSKNLTLIASISSKREVKFPSG